MISFKNDKDGDGGNNQETWRFFDYSVPNTNYIEDWYKALSLEAQTRFDSILKNNYTVDLFKNWMGFRGFLVGKYQEEKIWELGFQADKRQYRLLGIFGKERKQAIFLIGCYHKGKIYTPPNALDSSFSRAKCLLKELQEGRVILNERKIKFDI